MIERSRFSRQFALVLRDDSVALSPTISISAIRRGVTPMILEKFNNRDEQSWENWKFRFASERWTRLARSWNWTWMALTRVCNHGVSRKDERWIPCFLLRLAPLRYSSSVPGATSDRSSISFSINLHWHRGPLPSQLPFNALNSKSYNVVHFGRTSSSIKFFQLFSFFFFFYIDRDIQRYRFTLLVDQYCL